ncbi:MAG: ankyrin repeat domain-containing protein [Proteobacteria bacterium]|nr:ankyrin repeat domain-containing protein [Pseudomonadota bacterium]MBU1742678.1 ankyrin repeat domain-containing protein [Pseudomonadota bacterium]
MVKRLMAMALVAALAAAGCGALYEIHDGAGEGDVQAVGVLLDRNPQLVHARNDFGDTPLHAAVKNGRIEVVRLLLQKGADVNARRQYTTREYAISFSDRPLDWEYAPIWGLNEVRVKDGETGLHLAAQYGRYRIAVLLIRAGARVARRDPSGWTPLHWAAAGGHLDVVELLVMNGSPWLTKTYLGETPSDLAAARGHTRVVAYLRRVMIHP